MSIFAPSVAYAAGSSTFGAIVDSFIQSIELAVLPLIVGAAFIAFLWGVAQYLRSAGDESRRKEGVTYMWYGLIGLTVIFSVWALVGILSGILGVEVGVPQLGG